MLRRASARSFGLSSGDGVVTPIGSGRSRRPLRAVRPGARSRISARGYRLVSWRVNAAPVPTKKPSDLIFWDAYSDVTRSDTS
jgi:hypothetical protein